MERQPLSAEDIVFVHKDAGHKVRKVEEEEPKALADLSSGRYFTVTHTTWWCNCKYEPIAYKTFAQECKEG